MLGDVSAEFPDLFTADASLIDQALVRLQRRWLTASHLVGESTVVPEGIDEESLRWWREAWLFRQRSRFGPG